MVDLFARARLLSMLLALVCLAVIAGAPDTVPVISPF